MSLGRDSSKTLMKFKEKKMEQPHDRGRSVRNSLEKSKNDILDAEDKNKQSKSDKTSAKPQATQGDTSSTSASKVEAKRKSAIANEESSTCPNKDEKKKDTAGKIEEDSGPAKLNRRNRKLERTASGNKEDKEQHENGIVIKSTAPSSGTKPHMPVGYGEEIARHLRSKIDFTPGARLEARDFTERWYAAKVVEVDWEEEEVLVHFEKWSSRFDEWISMDSPRLRPPTLASSSSKTKNNQFREGEKVMAFWLDRQKYPAKVLKVLPNDNYEIRFFDGYTKTVSGKRMLKATEKEIEKAKKEMPMRTLPGNTEGTPVAHTSIFADTDIGTKEDRRRRKRKIDVAGLFSKNYRTSMNKKEAQDVQKAMDNSLKEPQANTQVKEKEESKVDSQNDDESPEEGRLVFDSEDEAEENTYSPQPVEPAPESSSPPRGKGMRTKFKPPSKDIADTPESSRKRKIQTLDDSSTNFLRLQFKSRKSTPGPRKRLEPPIEKEPEIKMPYESPAPYRKQTKEPIHVPDKRLPTGWRKFAIKRKIGASAGKWDIYMQSPDGRKIRSPHALRAFFAKRGVENVNYDRFDFAPSKAVFPRDGGRPALALSPEEVSALEDEKTPVKISNPGPAVRLSSGGPKVILPKGSHTVSPVAKRLKTLMPRSRGSMGETSDEVSPQTELNSPVEAVDSNSAWKETNCKMDSTYICPKEGCGKNFRKENLLQMHIKHYHPEYCKLVGSAPNVADLASARMDGGESLFDFRPARVPRSSPLESSGRGGRGRGRWASVKRGGISRTVDPHAPSSSEQTAVGELPGGSESDSRWDTPSAAPTIKTILPVRSSESPGESSLPAIPPPPEIENVVQDGVQLVQEVVTDTPLVQLPLPKRRLMGAGRRKRRLTFLPTHMAKRRKFGLKSHTEAEGNDAKEERTTVSGLSVSAVGGGVRRRRKRKSELLSREEIVNCICGSPEEDGLMMQCELCLCWQHGHCNNIEREVEVPEKYICYICLNPQKQRKSMKYFHDQDWLKKGVLPSLSFRGKEDDPKINQRFRVLKKSHELTGSLLQLNTVVHSLRVKVNMIGNTDHPKLYLWSKSWEAGPSNEIPEGCSDSMKVEHDKMEPPCSSAQATSTYGDITKTEDNLPELTMEQSLVEERDKDPPSLLGECNVPIDAIEPKQENVVEGLDGPSGSTSVLPEDKGTNDDSVLNDDAITLDTSATLTASSDDLKQDQTEEALAMADVSINEDSPKLDGDLLHGHSVGDDDCPPVLELPLSQSEIQQLASSVEDKLRATEVRAPQPEAPIDPFECQLTLLDHIESMQQEVDSRLTLIEAQVAALEAEDDEIAFDEPPEFYPHTKQTIQMIMRDMNTARHMASYCGKS